MTDYETVASIVPELKPATEVAALLEHQLSKVWAHYPGNNQVHILIPDTGMITVMRPTTGATILYGDIPEEDETLQYVLIYKVGPKGSSSQDLLDAVKELTRDR
jgi:hypothetical protein